MNNNVTPDEARLADQKAEAEPAIATAAPRLPPWLQEQLARVYSNVVREPLPQDLMELVRKLDVNE